MKLIDKIKEELPEYMELKLEILELVLDGDLKMTYPTELKKIITEYIDKNYTNTELYEEGKLEEDYLQEKDFEPLIELIDIHLEKKLKKISVLDKSAIFESMFGREIEEIEVKNTFKYQNSIAFSELNKVVFNTGVILETPSGREGKLRPCTYFKVKDEEYVKETKTKNQITSGEVAWIGFEETLKSARKKLFYEMSKKDEQVRKELYPRPKNIDAKILKKVISTGSGFSEVFEVKPGDIEFLEKTIREDKTYVEQQQSTFINKIKNELEKAIKAIKEKKESERFFIKDEEEKGKAFDKQMRRSALQSRLQR